MANPSKGRGLCSIHQEQLAKYLNKHIVFDMANILSLQASHNSIRLGPDIDPTISNLEATIVSVPKSKKKLLYSIRLNHNNKVIHGLPIEFIDNAIQRYLSYHQANSTQDVTQTSPRIENQHPYDAIENRIENNQVSIETGLFMDLLNSSTAGTNIQSESVMESDNGSEFEDDDMDPLTTDQIDVIIQEEDLEQLNQTIRAREEVSALVSIEGLSSLQWKIGEGRENECPDIQKPQ